MYLSLSPSSQPLVNFKESSLVQRKAVFFFFNVNYWKLWKLLSLFHNAWVFFITSQSRILSLKEYVFLPKSAFYTHSESFGGLSELVRPCVLGLLVNDLKGNRI